MAYTMNQESYKHFVIGKPEIQRYIEHFWNDHPGGNVKENMHISTENFRVFNGFLVQTFSIGQKSENNATCGTCSSESLISLATTTDPKVKSRCHPWIILRQRP